VFNYFSLKEFLFFQENGQKYARKIPGKVMGTNGFKYSINGSKRSMKYTKDRKNLQNEF